MLRFFGGVTAVLALCLAGLIHAGPALADIVIERGVTGHDGMLSDRFTWTDASGQSRVGVLAHNNAGAGPGGSQGGELRELRYQTPGGTRFVRASGSAFAGFGYVVSHPTDTAACLGGDDSPLGHFTPGQFQRVFEGRHHVIFRFTQNYPRICTKNGPAAANVVPVTIDWVFATGRDHPLWAVTWDLSAIPVNTLEDDSRAPYGELLFDGSATEIGHSQIAGVGWGDGFKFLSLDNPVTYNSAWTWATPNTVPYVKLWTTAVDATMGTVLTQTKAQQDAGGYFGADDWGQTSIMVGLTCGGGEEFPGSLAHRMPCSYNWPYQSINFSFGQACFCTSTDDSTTNNTRLAWGTNFGFLGQDLYLVHGSQDLGGPDPNTFAPGWPRKSYSTFIVLGLHSLLPVEAQVTQVERVQLTTLSATIGSVLTSGPAGVNRTDAVTYAPAGWNHVYAAWAVQAAGNQVDVNFNAAGGALVNPLVIVSGWTSGGLPGAVRFNGASLVQDVDYFPSARAGSQELWITLNRTLAGPTNRLEVLPPTAPPAPPFDLDGRDDLAIYRGTTGQWLITRSLDGLTSTITWGDPALADKPVSADFDGDGQGDVAVYRGATGQWFVLLSTGGVSILTWGDPAQQDVPVAADFDGDGRADITVYRGLTGQWFVLRSTGGVILLTWGDPALLDVPVPADYDGDGRADIAVYRRVTGQWFVLLSGGGVIILTWGDPAQQDIPVPGRYDFDTRADITVYRGLTGQWFVLNSGGGVSILTWGDPAQQDVPVPADYDGDGRTDIAVWRRADGSWFVIRSAGGVSIVNTGAPLAGDQPVPLRRR